MRTALIGIVIVLLQVATRGVMTASFRASFVSSFWWAGQAPLSTGVDYSHQLVLALATATTLTMALVLIGRRDLETA